MKTLEQARAEHAAELAKLEREHALAAQLPIEPASVMEHGDRSAWVNYKRPGIREALELFAAFIIVPMSKAKNGCLHLEPVEAMPERLRDAAEGVYAVALDVSQGEGFGPSARLHFYARIGSQLIRVNVDIGRDYIGAYNALRAEPYETRDHRNRVTERTFRANHHANTYSDDRIGWATGEYGAVRKGAHFTYLWSAEHDAEESGAEQRHARDMLTHLADALKEPTTEGAQ